MQVPTIELSSFAQRISIEVEKSADDGSEVCYLQSVFHDRSSLVTEFFMLKHQIITGKARWGPSLLLYRKFACIPLYMEWMDRVLPGFD